MIRQFFGSTTMGERGQLVVPIEAREKLKIEKGEKLLVFGVHDKAIVITKLSSFKRLQKEMGKRYQEVEDLLKKI
ncbi:AbrB family transcriptional regulator [Candidatus Berkelbacteria bacterium CG08_land_8_20_14_0_20_39_8]|uniref:AbrB family transcriptional regulator n=1 Tax=Candidatus Berkelbacteria bacterium CG08_land_8_20_14_0_20_39_8 TaxID=1974511 RepID=A0A2M6YBR0_9BACT|nr:MAG: AbrB family transcriptional regulator [Candidatus Berkelbacteria bacterium CG08_land_8_20_14_0_20_39_8]